MGLPGRTRLATPEEVAYLKFKLLAGRTVLDIKRALQGVCRIYEEGRTILDSGELRQLIHSHLGAGDVELRRYSIKALGLIGVIDDAKRIVDRLRAEEDLEAQTWGVAALVRINRKRSVREVCAEARLDSDKLFSLAARLYASPSWINEFQEEHRISLNDDETTLIWAVFLAGYNKAPTDLFHPRHANAHFLGELTLSPKAKLAEGAVWALWERVDYNFGYCRVSLDALSGQPPGVRKWLYRLAQKSPAIAGLTKEAIAEFARSDDSASAREGLAQGLTGLNLQHYGDEIVQWFAYESDAAVRETILASLSQAGGKAGVTDDLVVEAFLSVDDGHSLQSRLIAASAGTSLYQRLRTEQALRRQRPTLFGGLDQFAGAAPLIIANRDVVENNSKNLYVGRDLSAKTISLGDMINSANESVEQLGADRGEDHEVLSAVVQYLKDAQLADHVKEPLLTTVQEVTAIPSPENKKKLFDQLADVAKGIAAFGGAAGGIDKLLHLAQNWQF